MKFLNKNMVETTRDIINKYRNRLADATNLSPVEASQYIVELASYMGNITELLVEKQMNYNKKKAKCLEEVKSVAKAEVKAQCSEEYREQQEVKGYLSLITELIRACKYYVRASEDEQSFVKHT